MMAGLMGCSILSGQFISQPAATAFPIMGGAMTIGMFLLSRLVSRPADLESAAYICFLASGAG